MNFKGVQAGVAEIAEVFRDPQALGEISRLSLRMAPAVALLAIGSALEDRDKGKVISQFTKASAAGVAGTVVAGVTASRQLEKYV